MKSSTKAVLLTSSFLLALLRTCLDAFTLPSSPIRRSSWTLPHRKNCLSRDDSFLHAGRKHFSDDPKLRPEHEIEVVIAETGEIKQVTLIARIVPIHPGLNITVWERKDPSEIMGAYWEAQASNLENLRDSQRKLLDPFGLVSWPGSVKAAQELCQHVERAVKDRNVVVLGAGVGVEAQTAAILGAKRVLATDIHPTTLQQLEFGVQQEPLIAEKDVVQTQILDLFETHETQPIPLPCDLLIVADVLYNEQLAMQVCRRCVESFEQNPDIRILITDSQRFVPTFVDRLNEALSGAAATMNRGDSFQEVQWEMEIMKGFTGSGVMIDEDQTYDVKVQSLWIGLNSRMRSSSVSSGCLV